MDPKKATPGKSKLKNLLLGTLFIVGVACGGIGFYRYATKKSLSLTPSNAHAESSSHDKQDPHHSSDDHKSSEKPDSHASGHPQSHSQLSFSIHHFLSEIHRKVKSFHEAEEENKRLRLENAQLLLRLENSQFECTAEATASQSRKVHVKLDKETGSTTGRTLASIQYRPPTHLLPPQLYTLGVSYFNAREDEKAVVILSYLTNLEDNQAYKTPRNFLFSGIAWYRVENFEVADQAFERVLQSPENLDNLPYHAQARLWKGLVAQRLQKHSQSQKWLRELLDHHPQSNEARWVNQKKEVSVAPQSHGHAAPEHH